MIFKTNVIQTFHSAPLLCDSQELWAVKLPYPNKQKDSIITTQSSHNGVPDAQLARRNLSACVIFWSYSKNPTEKQELTFLSLPKKKIRYFNRASIPEHNSTDPINNLMTARSPYYKRQQRKEDYSAVMRTRKGFQSQGDKKLINGLSG